MYLVALYAVLTFHPAYGNFLCTKHLPDGIKEDRLNWMHVLAIKTTAQNPDTPSLWQLTEGEKFIQLIYTPSTRLADCEYLNEPSTVSDFTDKFRSDYECARSLRDENSVAKCGNTECMRLRNLPDAFINYTNYDSLEEQCTNFHRAILDLLRRRPRNRRELFLYPGTNWCGFGSSVKRFQELGYNSHADRCCRDHDLCPYTIAAFSRKYHAFNYRFHTISHCDCDERFRACLKLANSPTANIVGRLFFNVVQTKCFFFQIKSICSKWSWWGRCLQNENQTIAVLKDALTY